MNHGGTTGELRQLLARLDKLEEERKAITRRLRLLLGVPVGRRSVRDVQQKDVDAFFRDRL